MMPKFEHLMSPITVGNVTWRNRIFKTAASSNLMVGSNGYVTEALKQFYWSFAKGGVGCVFIESPNIDEPLGMPGPGFLRLDDDKFISGFKELVNGIHRHGAKASLQIWHAGPWHLKILSGLTPVAPSPHCETEVGFLSPPTVCEELSLEKIETITEQFVNASERARKAGFDSIDLNCGANHLLASFMSRFWNYRTDEYGYDSLENRTRFPVNIIKAIKKRCGNDFSVGVLMNGTEYNMGDMGNTREECVEFAKIFEAAGANSFHIRTYQHMNIFCYWPEQFFYPDKKAYMPEGMDFSRKGPGAFIPDAYAVKKAVSVPVFTPGRWNGDFEYAEECIKQGKIDAIGITRGLNADPELPQKIKKGQISEIRPCTACMTCNESFYLPEPTYTYCRINPFLGKEFEYEVYPAPVKKKNILVAGGGPSGMEAARSAARRGHNVTIYSGDDFLGGLMPMATMIKGDYPENVQDIIDWYKSELKKLGVKIVTGEKVTIKHVEQLKPDVVVVATGGIPVDRTIPGSDNKKVISSDLLLSKLRTALKFSKPNQLNKATKLWMPIGKSVVIMGANIKGLQLATFLIKRRKKVTVVEEGDMIGEGGNIAVMWVLGNWLRKKGCTLSPSVKYVEINDKGLVIINKHGERQTIEAESILPLIPLQADNNLAKQLEGKVPEIHICGSCNNPGLIRDAINEGFQVGMAL